MLDFVSRTGRKRDALEPPSLNHSNQDHNDRYNQQNMNKPAHARGSNKPEPPKYNQYNRYRFQHNYRPIQTKSVNLMMRLCL